MAFQKAMNQTAWAKIGTMGRPGSGKTTLLALIALYLSKKYHNGAPVAMIDSEKGSDFLIEIFKAEGVDFFVEKTNTLADLRTASRRSIEAGCCALVADSITKFWGEAMAAIKKSNNTKRLTVDLIGRLKDEWQPFADDFVDSKIHYLAAGRLGWEWENAEYEDEDGRLKKELMKGGTKMKAEGEFAHDFDLQIEMASIDDPDAVQFERLKVAGKKTLRKKFSASVLHVATVKKCRVWALNGQVYRWADQAGYKPGYYTEVGKVFQPYFDSLCIGGAHVSIDHGRTSASLFDRNNEQSYGAMKIGCEVAIENWDTTMGLIYPGQTADNKRARAIIGEAITGTRSKTAFERQSLAKLENQVAVLMALEQRMKAEPPKTETDLVALIEMAKEDAANPQKINGREIAAALLAPAQPAVDQDIPF